MMKMSKELKEKCKECAYYNDKQQYPDVEGTTTHSNCLSIKCQYRKITKDMQIGKLKHKLADLEAKLAETVKDYEELVNKQKQEIREYDKEDMRLRDYAKSLEQQLAEKEKEIEEVKEWWACQYKANTERKDQDKNSFCIEQLEKVKDEIGEKIDTFIDSYGDRCIEVVDLEFFIDNQIKQLKEMK